MLRGAGRSTTNPVIALIIGPSFRILVIPSKTLPTRPLPVNSRAYCRTPASPSYALSHVPLLHFTSTSSFAPFHSFALVLSGLHSSFITLVGSTRISTHLQPHLPTSSGLLVHTSPLRPSFTPRSPCLPPQHRVPTYLCALSASSSSLGTVRSTWPVPPWHLSDQESLALL